MVLDNGLFFFAVEKEIQNCRFTISATFTSAAATGRLGLVAKFRK
jgi:hypothetical protein